LRVFCWAPFRRATSKDAWLAGSTFVQEKIEQLLQFAHEYAHVVFDAVVHKTDNHSPISSYAAMTEGFAVTLEQAGIASIALSKQATTKVSNFDGRGNSLTSQDGAEFTRADGTTGDYGDVWFKYLSGAYSDGLAS